MIQIEEITMKKDLNHFAEKVTQQLFQQGLTPEEVLTMFSIGVLTITPFVHPAGFETSNKTHYMNIISKLNEFNPNDKETH